MQSLDNGLELIKEDSSIHKLCSAMNGHSIIEVYVKHEVNCPILREVKEEEEVVDEKYSYSEIDAFEELVRDDNLKEKEPQLVKVQMGGEDDIDQSYKEKS